MNKYQQLFLNYLLKYSSPTFWDLVTRIPKSFCDDEDKKSLVFTSGSDNTGDFNPFFSTVFLWSL